MTRHPTVGWRNLTLFSFCLAQMKPFLVLFTLFALLFPLGQSSLHITDFSQLEQLPSRVYFTDGNELHFSLILNVVKSYLYHGGNPDEIFVLAYTQQTKEYLRSVGINTLFFPKINIEIWGEVEQMNCPDPDPFGFNFKAHFMGVVMELKLRLWLEFCRLEKQFLVFDSDVVFNVNPALLFEPDVAPGMYAPDIVASYFTDPNNLVTAIGIQQPDYLMNPIGFQSLELNFSPTAVVNPKKMYPILQELLGLEHYHVKKDCGPWGYGWGQTLPNVILYRSGLRWSQSSSNETAVGVWANGCQEEGEFCLKGVNNNPFATGKERELSVGKWAGLTLKCRYYTHYAMAGGGTEKSKEIMRSGDWYLPCKYARGPFLMPSILPDKDILNPDFNCLSDSLLYLKKKPKKQRKKSQYTNE